MGYCSITKRDLAKESLWPWSIKQRTYSPAGSRSVSPPYLPLQSRSPRWFAWFAWSAWSALRQLQLGNHHPQACRSRTCIHSTLPSPLAHVPGKTVFQPAGNSLHPVLVLVLVRVRHRVRSRGLSFHPESLIWGCGRPSSASTTLALTPAVRISSPDGPAAAQFVCRVELPWPEFRRGTARTHVRSLRRHLPLRAQIDAVVASWPNRPRSPSRSNAQLRYAACSCRLVNLSILISPPARHSCSLPRHSKAAWTGVRDPLSPTSPALGSHCPPQSPASLILLVICKHPVSVGIPNRLRPLRGLRHATQC